MINRLARIKLGRKTTLFVVLVTICVGVFFRFYAMRRGFNFDFESYKIVGDIVTNGGNVYNETTRYNYGPVWFAILGFFREIGLQFNNPDVIFRVLIVGLLTIVDLSMAFILKRKFGLLAFVLFFLNPVSIAITGYHNQFDNLAVLMGIVSLLVLPKDTETRVERRHIYSAVLLGLSLMTKHIFFMLPMWLFFRGRTLRIKLTMLMIPLGMFALSFAPFWSNGHTGIIQNVFLYKSFANAPLLNALLSQAFLVHINPMILLVGVLLAIGLVTRKLPAFESALWYLVALVVFSPAIANQYLAIAMPAAISLGVIFFVPFILFSSILLIVTSVEGLHMTKILNLIPDRILPYISPDGTSGQYKLIIFCLFIGGVLAAVYRYRREWYAIPVRAFKGELKEQISFLRH